MHYDLMVAARKALAARYERGYAIAYENLLFTPPDGGGMWLKFDYKEVDSDFVSLDRKCRVYVGIVQISVVFPPNAGTDRARQLAKDIANFFEDGKILETGYISEGASVHPVQKSETGWFVPVRFNVRFEERRK